MKNNVVSLEEEIRCDFLVSPKRKKIWKTQLDMAMEVKRICEKHKIKYFIIWGTLLGAVRHKGYIPWDDDFDIGFLRKDYDHFCKIAKKEIVPPLFFQDALSDRKYFIGYARIRDSRTTGWILHNSSPKYHNGIFIDLYPLDVIPDNLCVWTIQTFLVNCILKHLCKRSCSDNKKMGDTKYKCLVVLHRLCCSIFNWRQHPKRVGIMYWPHETEIGYWIYAEDVKQTIKLTFENTSFSAPKGYDRILKNVYGNYMKYPPKGKRGTWHNKQIIFDPDISYLEFYKNKMEKKRRV